MSYLFDLILPVFTTIMSVCIGVCLILWFICYLDNVVYPSDNNTCQSHLIVGEQHSIKKE